MTAAHTVFNETAALLVLGAAIGFLGQWLRQPMIVAFIVAGIVAGPDVLGVVSSAVHVQVLGELGVAILLFLVGLKLDPGLLRTLGPVALVTGTAQVLLTALAGAALAWALGMPVQTAAVVGLALTFSSTIIVIKLLWDKGEVDSLHGRVALGLLIAQDLLVVVLMGLLAGLRGGAQGGLWQALAGGFVMLGTVLLFTRYLAQGLLGRMARSPELLVTFAVAWAALLAAMADTLGLGKELGGLLAGVSLASTPFREALASRLASVRDFLLLFFFVSLGASLDFGALDGNLLPAMVLSAFVLVGKPLIVLPILALAGYGRRTSFVAGLTLAQISEFSLILLALATQAGLADPATREGHSESDILLYVCMPGFSTVDKATRVSGRGVGMDVVSEFVVEKLRGALDVESVPGEGATFSLTIPLTLALIRALLVRVDGQTFAVPTVSITETLRIDPAEVMRTEGHDVIRRERRTIPLVSMCEVLGFDAAVATPRRLPVIVVGLSGRRMAFVVDAMLGEQRIVIKTLADQLGRAEMVAGVTVLGAGEVVPILDVSALIARGREISGFRSRRPQPAVQQPARRRRVLICEDSFTTRELERSIFEAAGYSVETAPDGAQGLAKLKEGIRVDAVVTDVQMPAMTGFELARAIKADPALKGIPVVIVTSLERAEEKAEGIDSGADAYITKSVFNQDTLLDTVERLMG
jgi:Kef-type K+ transport system membrane component KefB/ActR/RegA family two-component response regulator